VYSERRYEQFVPKFQKATPEFLMRSRRELPGKTKQWPKEKATKSMI